jgi:flagellar hook-associated protein 2
MAGFQSIDGLASNLNTTEIINSIIEYERRPALLMEQQKASKTNEITTFNALAAKLLALQSSISLLNEESAFSQASISVSNELLLTATADGAVGTGSYSLNILSLAQNHQIASHGFANASQSLMGTGTITLALGDRSPMTLTIDADNNSLVGIKDAINEANIGITASIVDDGSSSKPYRLVLTGDETGRKNNITVTSSLSGGLDIDFQTTAFDDPEVVSFSSQATSQVSLGATASYTGSTNKVYSFTVAGSGAQTVGSGNITIDWTDGTNSGSIVVSQADTEVVGPDGLKLSFGDGDLVGGDTFQVSTFAPVLQKAADAQVSIGSDGTGSSPLVVSSANNQIEDLIPGLTIDLHGVTTATTGPVTIQTGLNTAGIKNTINSFIDAYNDVTDFINEQNDFDPESKEGGILLGDLTLMTIQSRLSRLFSEPVAGLDKSMNTLSAIGIRTGLTGKLSLRESSKLTAALEKDFEAVLRLFVDGGTSSINGISFISTPSTIDGGTEFAVDITQAATHGYLQGQRLVDPATNNITLTDTNDTLKFRIDGIVSDEIVLSSRTYTSGDELARELQTRIDADEKIGKMGVTAEWVDLGGEGYLKLTSATYGSSSKVETITSISNSAFSSIGLVGSVTLRVGEDVQGTINGESATGKGQALTGDEGNATTDGLKLKVTLTQSQLGTGDEGTITITRGFASVLEGALDSITKTGDGVIARKTGGLQGQIDSITKQIEDFDERLALRRESLVKKWTALEMVLAELQTEQDFLASQLASITSNFTQIIGNE